jgi:hypothetical protein
VDGDHGPFRWCFLLNHRGHCLWHHLRLPLRLHDILGYSFRGPRLTVRSRPRSRPDNHICGSCACRSDYTGGSGPGQKGSKKKKEKRGESWTKRGFQTPLLGRLAGGA